MYRCRRDESKEHDHRTEPQASANHDLTHALYETALAVSSSVQLDEVLDRMVGTTAEMMNAKGCSIRLLSDDGQRLDLVAATGLSEAYLKKGLVEVVRSPLDQEALTGKTVIVLNAAEDPRLQYSKELAEEGIRSILCAPLVSRNEPIGVIRVYSAACYLYTDDDATFLELVASAGAAAIANARAYQQLEEANRAKSRFVRLVAHELRSPLGAVGSLLEVVLGGYGGSVDEKGAELLRRAERRLQFLLILVNDLLDLASGRMESVQYDRSRVDLQAVAEHVVGLLQARAQEKRVSLTLEAAPANYILWGIPEHLESLFSNLVDNAIKYTPAGGCVAVSLRREGEQHVFSVADSGIGIPTEAVPYIFDEFYRAPNARESEKEGTGLGLAIARQIIDEHHGEAHVESQVDAGTTITITFPIEPLVPNGHAPRPLEQ